MFECRSCAGENNYFLRPMKIFLLFHQCAVAIKKNSLFHVQIQGLSNLSI